MEERKRKMLEKQWMEDIREQDKKDRRKQDEKKGRAR